MSSFEKMRGFRERYLSAGSNLRILDVGSQDVNGSYRALFDEPQWQYLGVDLCAGRNVDVVLSDPYEWTAQGLRSNFFDVVISGQVLEHVEFPWLTLAEIDRVLRPNGLVCLIVPSSGPEHRYPVDCWRFYPDGLRALSRYVGWNTLEAGAQWADAGYKDGSDQWHDAWLIARKPPKSFRRRLSVEWRRILLRLLNDATPTSRAET